MQFSLRSQWLLSTFSTSSGTHETHITFQPMLFTGMHEVSQLIDSYLPKKDSGPFCPQFRYIKSRFEINRLEFKCFVSKRFVWSVSCVPTYPIITLTRPHNLPYPYLSPPIHTHTFQATLGLVDWFNWIKIFRNQIKG